MWIELPVVAQCMTICSHIDKISHFAVNITYITQEEEEQLDNGDTIIIKRDGIHYTIDPKSIFCYGEIDFHTSSDDYLTIEDFDWLKHADNSFIIPSRLNYDNGTAFHRSRNRPYTWIDTFNSAAVAQYLHCKIGKPKRTLIFIKKW